MAVIVVAFVIVLAAWAVSQPGNGGLDTILESVGDGPGDFGNVTAKLA
jgi:hypothetical protein